MRLPNRNPGDGGMSLRTHGQQFLDLIDHIEHFSRGDRASDSEGEPRTTGPSIQSA